MSRVGEERTFREGVTLVRAVPIVATTGLADPIPSDCIDRVVVSHSLGLREDVERVCRELRDRYEGALYSTWLCGIAG